MCILLWKREWVPKGTWFFQLLAPAAKRRRRRNACAWLQGVAESLELNDLDDRRQNRFAILHARTRVDAQDVSLRRGARPPRERKKQREDDEEN
jgi:hypothetical protein